MAQLELEASGVYILRWWWQDDKNQHRQVCLVKMHLSSGVTSMSVCIQVNPLSAPPCPTHETKALPMFVWFTSLKSMCSHVNIHNHTHTHKCTETVISYTGESVFTGWVNIFCYNLFAYTHSTTHQWNTLTSLVLFSIFFHNILFLYNWSFIQIV